MYVFKSVMCCSCFCDTKVKDGTRTQNTFLTKQLAFEEETHSKLCSALASEPRIHNFQSDTFLCKIPIYWHFSIQLNKVGFMCIYMSMYI